MVVNFNSLSRDHLVLCGNSFLMPEISTPSLGITGTDYHVATLGMHAEISTPSLGITNSNRIIPFFLSPLDFNSLSRDHFSTTPLEGLRPDVNFNSLSRDHTSLLVMGSAFRPCPNFNSLSRDHNPSGRGR
jgi:hypothetical protein